MARKMPSAAMMRRAEKKETEADEEKESPAYQKREKKLKIEEDKRGKRKPR